ncbi:triose-phosphate isomerase [Kitasatospora cheerisanensis KCTC 2395]|uniref:Triose-phosphate isomerase n=1 Tax=Kitasatospora cheerisanensis KCTC 2395 TaxID=1348663 RepID=A0A066Z2L4_9ACTN|nr:triose-phosphate isomerase [Kitasatospora cheerisanensis KCTC 2395]
MSFHLHLRAVPSAEVRPDSAWIEPFMRESWDNHAAEYDAGIADSIEKDFAQINQLYTGAPDGPADPGNPSGLPIFGGTSVPREDGPPFVLLSAEQVADAAAFLSVTTFDSRWEASGAAISAHWGGEPAFVREIFLGHHEDLVAFYRAAADSGKAVLKAFWY